MTGLSSMTTACTKWTKAESPLWYRAEDRTTLHFIYCWCLHSLDVKEGGTEQGWVVNCVKVGAQCRNLLLKHAVHTVLLEDCHMRTKNDKPKKKGGWMFTLIHVRLCPETRHRRWHPPLIRWAADPVRAQPSCCPGLLLFFDSSASSLSSNRPICLVRADNEPVELTAEVSLTPSLLPKLSSCLDPLSVSAWFNDVALHMHLVFWSREVYQVSLVLYHSSTTFPVMWHTKASHWLSDVLF